MKLSKEIGARKAAQELGIPVDTLYGWQKAVREGRLDAGPGSHAPETAMSLAEELAALRKPVKELEKANRRLKEENEFLTEAIVFLLRAVGSRQGTANEVHRGKDGRRRVEGQNIPVLPGTGGKPGGLLPVPGAEGSALEILGPGGRHVGDPQ